MKALAIGLSVWASTMSPSHAHSALELFERADLALQAEAIGPQIQEALDAQLTAVHGEQQLRRLEFDEIRKTIDTVFSARMARHAMLEVLDSDLSQRDRDQVVAWLDSATGKRITQAKQHAAHSDISLFDAFQRELENNPPAADRQAVLEELDTALGATEAAARLLIQFDLAVAIAHQTALERDDDIGESDPEFVIASQTEYEDAVRSHVQAHYHFALRDTPLQDVKRYIAFVTSSSGTRYVAAVQHGLERAIISGTWALIDQFQRFRDTPKPMMTSLEL